MAFMVETSPSLKRCLSGSLVEADPIGDSNYRANNPPIATAVAQVSSKSLLNNVLQFRTAPMAVPTIPILGVARTVALL
ncbi:MAG: hypothetical protein F4123_10230 [Gemmatimonadetes bacterium]|nr:hypothetical protein [Gemmatimonadota bacterium]MYB99665.1 hypothetical protein [Gemmatimonadota bacterium]MYI46734.1 hypothetical protein [Gemmatimonadota bacterium]